MYFLSKQESLIEIERRREYMNSQTFIDSLLELNELRLFFWSTSSPTSALRARIFFSEKEIHRWGYYIDFPTLTRDLKKLSHSSFIRDDTEIDFNRIDLGYPKNQKELKFYYKVKFQVLYSIALCNEMALMYYEGKSKRYTNTQFKIVLRQNVKEKYQRIFDLKKFIDQSINDLGLLFE